MTVFKGPIEARHLQPRYSTVIYETFHNIAERMFPDIDT